MMSSHFLFAMAEKYIWWKTPSEAMQYPNRIISQIMNIGDYADIQNLVKNISKEDLMAAIKTAEIGQFNEKSWHYWHYRLGLATLGHVPSLPQNRFQ